MRFHVVQLAAGRRAALLASAGCLGLTVACSVLALGPTVMTTLAPSSTKRRAVARPIPLLPPVITATFPDSLLMSYPFLGGYAGPRSEFPFRGT
jgi:hypothetical protein